MTASDGGGCWTRAKRLMAWRTLQYARQPARQRRDVLQRRLEAQGICSCSH